MTMKIAGKIMLAAAIGAAAGCMGNKASHQNGVVLYLSTSGQIGIGYGETEDLPAGCRYEREVTQISPAILGDEPNYVHTVTKWDTTGICTNAPAVK